MIKLPAKKARPKKRTLNPVNFQEFPFARLIPNFATIAALCTGLSAIRFAILGDFQNAAVAIFVAAFLDGIDGRIARLLKATSDFGAELDSLSDFISFGVSPAIVTYLLTLQGLHGLGWGIALFYASCMGFRLARFNAMTLRQSPQKKTDDTSKKAITISAGPSKFFLGVPAPAGAFIALFPLFLHLAFQIEWVLSPYFYLIFMILSGVLMISRLPTYSFKSMTIQKNWVLPTLVLVVIFVAAFVSAPWTVTSLCVLIYLVTLPFSYYAYRKLKAQEKMA